MSGERARLFAALELPEDVRDALGAWRDHAIGGMDGVRPVADADLHVTLCFLGWRPVDEVDAIAGACRVVEGSGSVSLSVGEAVALPRRRPRVLAVSLEDGGGRLGSAQAVLAAALSAGGWYAPEARPFHAHVTVARAGRGARIARGGPAGPAPPAISFDGRFVVVYRSRLRRSGASYEPLARIALESA